VGRRAALLAPIALHAGCSIADLRRGGAALGFAQALSVMMFLAVLMCWLEGFFYPIEALYPLLRRPPGALRAAAGVLPRALAPTAVSFEFRVHLVFGMLAYSLFTVAMLHAVLIAKVGTALHAAPGRRRLAQLPPLLSLERWCSRSSPLLSSCLPSRSLSASSTRRPPRPRHALRAQDGVRGPAWLIFGLLLGGRWRYGWRGAHALRWTLTGFVLLMLAYPAAARARSIVHRA